MPQEYLSAIEICFLGEFSESTLRQMVRDGRWPATSHRLGGRNLWTTDAVRSALDRLSGPWAEITVGLHVPLGRVNCGNF
jgi:hypothetical protein